MTYDELQELTRDAWDAFFKVFGTAGIIEDDLATALDHKDCFNNVDDAVMSVVVLEQE